ncbi:dihydrolipoamide acetyltransferase family protein [Fulvivirgaceae bacterium BMA10]|uniref:Dihydrolipoamide acetyltransferase component of pyruvate dehydrogenase complex n=1 Tax=Splendidivirga corallicola TaxID=3051826 RepID=A0ABT8KHY8_9BACT|nr:dihydrolipoamide acetyltransferase family protein [Fulvivirgaceae bacterium BMA10]
MALVEMVMPKMGESIMEGTILSWLKKVGDEIEQDESVLEVATDKVDTEVPSTHAGVLKEILAQEGDVVQVGKAIAIIDTESDESISPSTPTEESIPEEEIVENTVEQTVAQENGNVVVAEAVPSSGRFYSPLVLNIAKEENIPMQELEGIPGSGKEGRVTKKDILAYVKDRSGSLVATPEPNTSNGAGATTVITAAPTQAPAPKVNVSVNANDEIIEMDRMRKMIAERMVDSKRISPHVTSFVEADVTEVVLWRNKVKNEFKTRENDNLTFTPIFIEAVVKAIKDYPMINVSVDGDKIIKRGDINIGMAVALPSGNLIVPVIKNADQLNIVGLTKKVNDLAKRARDNKLVPDELSGGTFTISNVGSFGNVMGTPIIMQPQVGILALGAIAKKPAVIETINGDAIAIRHKMFLSHSYDHRVVDGALGGMFVRRVADYLERFDINRTI